MAIKLKEIENRKCYEYSKELKSFEYVVKGIEGPHDEEKELRIWFERVSPDDYNLDLDKPAYKVFTIIDSVVYEKIFGMPKRNMNLEMVVATGLTLLKYTLLEEAKYKELISYTIADVVKDM